MSGIINKVKETLAEHKEEKAEKNAEQTGTTHNTYGSSNNGPHDSNITNAADPRVDSDRSKYNTSSTTGPTSTGAGMTGASHNNYESGRSSNHGPHDSNVANAADPRVDSDRSKSAYNTTSTTGPTSTLASGTGHTTNYDSGRSSNYGPHDTNIANTTDPRVDSDLSKRHTGAGTTGAGLTGAGHNTYGSGTTGAGTTGTGLTGAGHNAYGSGRSSNYGPHDSNIANTADPRVDSDLSKRHTAGTTGAGLTGAGAGTTGAGLTGASHNNYGSGTTGASTTGAGLTGASHNNYGSGTTGASTTGAGLTGASHNTYGSGRSSNYGPHDSNIANTADPRVDSDLSNRHGNTGYNTSSTGHHSNAGMAGAGLAGAGVGGAGVAAHHHNNTHNTRSSNYGPHDSNIANTTDPRVDSDLSNRHTGTGMTGTGAGLTGTGTGAGLTGASRSAGRSSNYGPHDSNIANTADPRVDSDLSNRHTGTGMTGTGAGLTGAGTGAGLTGASHSTGRSSNYGPHDSNIANTADPRVDSDLSNRHASTGVPSTHSYATGPASNTAGPHESNLANKADPRVDSDLSKVKSHHQSSMDSDLHTGGNPDTTTKSFEQAQKTAGVNPHVSSDGAGAGAGSSYNQHGSVGSKTNAGPHNSSAANKVDPRVDSDLDNTATSGTQRI